MPWAGQLELCSKGSSLCRAEIPGHGWQGQMGLIGYEEQILALDTWSAREEKEGKIS